MAQVRNPLEIYKLLPKSNCGRCYLPSCLAFAAAVVKGEKKTEECPHLDKSTAVGVITDADMIDPDEDKRQGKVRALQARIEGLDLAAVAGRIGGEMVGDSLRIKSLGKIFWVDRQGRVSSECHTHSGLTIPLLGYIVESKGGGPTGEWVPFRELRDGAAMAQLFARRGEQGLKDLVDRHTDLLELLIDIFSGERAVAGFSADISVILYPLPKLPVLISYWKAEDGLESDLNIFFDSTATDHLGIRSIYALAIGLVMMFEKIAQKHC